MPSRPSKPERPESPSKKPSPQKRALQSKSEPTPSAKTGPPKNATASGLAKLLEAKETESGAASLTPAQRREVARRAARTRRG